MKTKSNNGITLSKFSRKLSAQSFIETDSTDSEVHSKLRRSTRRATIERRVWFPPQKEKFYPKKCSNQGRPKGSKSAYVKWKESQKRKLGSRSHFLSKGKGRGNKDSTLNGEKFQSLSNGVYLLDSLAGEEVLGDNEAISLQSAITDEVITDTYGGISQLEIKVSELDSERKLTESHSPIQTSSLEDLTMQNILDPANQQPFLGDNLDGLLEQTSTIKQSAFPDNSNNLNDSKGDELMPQYAGGSAVDSDMHVSLDEALAELVDSEHATDCETVTIHPVFNDNEAKTHQETLLAPAVEESKALNLIVNTGNIDGSQCGENCEIESADMNSNDNSHFDDSKLDSNIQTDSENSYSSREEANISEGLIKMANIAEAPGKPSNIKTPLKCSECPMKFCSVRSLLWHFGTHLQLRSKQQGPIILEDLVAAWDSPDKPITVSDTHSYNYKEDYKWTWPRQSLSDDDSYKSSRCSNDGPEDLSVDRKCDSNFVGANGEFILKVPAIPKPRLGHSPSTNSPLRDILTAGNGSSSGRRESSKMKVFTRHLFPNQPNKSERNSACVAAQPIDVTPLPHPIRTPVIPKFAHIKIPPNNYPLQTITMPSNERNNSRPEYFRSGKSVHKAVSPHMFKAAFNCSNNAYLITASPPASSHLTPTISTCSAATSLDTCASDDANIRLLSQVSNTLNKLDTSPLRPDLPCQAIDMFDSGESVKENYSIEEEYSTDDATLVRINDSLALRIVATATTVGELTISVNDSGESSQKSNHYSNTVSIFPQPKASFGEIRPPAATPDILTIVPQGESVRNAAVADNSDREAPAAHIITASGRMTPHESRIVNLVLMPQRQGATGDGGGGGECSPSESSDSDGEESDCGMVIDVREEDSSMDPLSMCAVSLDDEGGERRAAAAAATCHDHGPAPTDIRGCSKEGKVVKNSRFVARVDDENYQKRKYVCQYCQKRFGWSTDLKRHIILHTGERPFKCKWCPINCTRKFLLQNHMRKVHPQLCKWSDLWD